MTKLLLDRYHHSVNKARDLVMMENWSLPRDGAAACQLASTMPVLKPGRIWRHLYPPQLVTAGGCNLYLFYST